MSSVNTQSVPRQSSPAVWRSCSCGPRHTSSAAAVTGSMENSRRPAWVLGSEISSRSYRPPRAPGQRNPTTSPRRRPVETSDPETVEAVVGQRGEKRPRLLGGRLPKAK